MERIKSHTLPLSINADKSPDNLKPDESAFLKNCEAWINNSGQNLGFITPVKSNYTDFNETLLPHNCLYRVEIPLGTSGAVVSSVTDGEETTQVASGECTYTVDLNGYGGFSPFTVSYTKNGVTTALPGTYNFVTLAAALTAVGLTQTALKVYEVTTSEDVWNTVTIGGSPFAFTDECDTEILVQDFLEEQGWSMVSSGVYEITTATIPDSVTVGIKSSPEEAPVLTTYDVELITCYELVGDNFCIGSHYERELNQFFWWNYNSAGRHHILMYNADTEVYTKVLETPLLNFKLGNRIPSHFLVLFAGERLLYWTEQMDYERSVENPIRKLNIDKALSGELWDVTTALLNYRTPEQWMRHDKYPPDSRPVPVLIQATGVDSDEFYNQQVRQKRFQFRTRFLYNDGERSKYSPISTLQQCTSLADAIKLTLLSAGSRDVDKIEICFREGNTGDWRLYDTLTREAVTTDTAFLYDASTNLFQYYFAGNKAYGVTDPAQTAANYDNTPIRCGALDLVTDDSMAVGNILEGYDNLPLEKIQTPELSADYLPFDEVGVPMRNVRVGILVHNPFSNTNQPAYRNSDFWVFGGIDYGTAALSAYTPDMGQELLASNTAGQRGITVYSAGTPYYATARLHMFDTSGNLVPINMDNVNEAGVLDNYIALHDAGCIFIFIADIKLPAGTHILRLADPRTSNFANTDYQLTSIPMRGFTALATYDINGGDGVASLCPEIYIDCTDNDIDLTVDGATQGSDDPSSPITDATADCCFVVYDLTDAASHTYVQTGYLKNSLTDPDALRIELAVLNVTLNIAAVSSSNVAQTDHNGFYWLAVQNSTVNFDYTITFDGEYNAIVATQISEVSNASSTEERAETDLDVDDTLVPDYTADSESYVEGTFSTGVGLAGQPVVIARGGWVLTDVNGDFAVPFHNDSANLGSTNTRYLYYPHGAVPLNWQYYTTGNDYTAPITPFDIEQMMAGAVCSSNQYNFTERPHITGFEAVVPPTSVPAKDCTGDPNADYPITVDTVPYVLSQLKQGALYRFGFVLYDEHLRSTFVQTDDRFVLNTPFITQEDPDATTPAGYKAISLEWDWNNLVLPDWVYYVAIVRTQNTFIQRQGWGGFLQWRIDTVKFTDDLGTDLSGSPAAASRIELKVTGLDTFNAANYFKTSTGYTYTEGDRIRFIQSDAGDFFEAPTGTPNAPDYQLRSTDGVTLVIDNDPSLHTLANGALAEIFTPRNAAQTDIYYEITGLLPTTRVAGNNQAVDQTVTLSTFDTYLFTRQMPRGTTTSWNPILVEHHSQFDTVNPSDGEDIGRPNVVNDEARQTWKPALMRHSLKFVPDATVNGLSTFQSENFKQYYREYGAITILHCHGSALHVIQENAAFYSHINKAQVQYASGTSELITSNEVFSNPQDVAGSYGCGDPCTFVSHDGLMFYWDIKTGNFIQHDGRSQTPISKKGLGAFFLQQSKLVQSARLNSDSDQVLVHAGFDPFRFRVVVSAWSGYRPETPPRGAALYVNTDTSLRPWYAQTVGYGLQSSAWDSAYGFVPEFYGRIDGSQHGNLLVTFMSGVPYFLNDDRATTYNVFFGLQTPQTVQATCCPAPVSTKRFLTMGYVSRKDGSTIAGELYDVPTVTTQTNQTSKVPQSAFAWKEGAYESNFFGSTATGKTLATGEPLVGKYANLTLVKHTNTYNELSDIFAYVIPSIKTP